MKLWLKKIFLNFQLGMNEWMPARLRPIEKWINERKNVRMNEWKNEWMKEWMNEWRNEGMKEWMKEWMNEIMKWMIEMVRE